jgi:transposase-like protein
VTLSNAEPLTNTESTDTEPLFKSEPQSHADAAGSGERAVPYYCPYCGEEDLRPEPEPRAAWRCVGCTRVFVVRFVGRSMPGVVTR